MTFEEFKTNVENWQADRGIYEHSTALAQALKAVSEVGELADAVIKGDRDELKDAIGDVMVCLVGAAKMTGCSINLKDADDAGPAKESPFLAAMVSYHVAYVASGIALGAGLWTVQRGIEDSIASLGDLALDNNLTLLECCEAAWNEIKDRKGKMVAGGAFVKDGDV